MTFFPLSLYLQLAAWQRLIFTFCSQAYSMTCGQSVGERMRKAQCTHGIQHGNPQHIQTSNDINITNKMVLEDLEDSPCRKFAIFFMPCSLLGFKKVMLNPFEVHHDSSPIMLNPLLPQASWWLWPLSVDEALPGRLWEPSQLFWLVVSNPLKNISQLGWLFPKKGKIKNVPNHQPVLQCQPQCLEKQKEILAWNLKKSAPGWFQVTEMFEHLDSQRHHTSLWQAKPPYTLSFVMETGPRLKPRSWTLYIKNNETVVYL